MLEKYPALLRIWHWLTVIAVAGLYVTVALRETVLDKKEVGAIVASKLQEFGMSLSGEQAIAVGKAVRAPMWEWHYLFGYLLAFAILVRIVAMLKGDASMPVIKVLRAKTPKDRGMALVHLGICFMLMVMTLTGLGYHFHEALGIAKESVHWAKEVHEFFVWPLGILIVLHIGGVVMHEIITKERIISYMVGGK